jgi:hypothetical protein
MNLKIVKFSALCISLIGCSRNEYKGSLFKKETLHFKDACFFKENIFKSTFNKISVLDSTLLNILYGIGNDSIVKVSQGVDGKLTISRNALPKNFKKFRNTEIKICDSFICMLDFENYFFSIYSIDNELNIREIGIYNLKSQLDWSKLYLWQYYPYSYEMIYPFLFIRIGNKHSEYGQDTSLFLKIGLDNKFDSIGENESIGITPKNYLTGHPFPNSFIRNISDSLYCIVNLYNDTIQIFNKSLGSSSRIYAKGSSSSFTYNSKKIKDLGYLNELYQLDQMNLNLVANNISGYILLVKRIKKNKVDDKNQYEYLVYDKDFKLIAFNRFEETLDLRFILSYKNGFLIPNKSFNEWIYYEIH